MVCEWDVPLSMLGKSLKVAVCLSGPKNGRFSRGRCYASLDSRRARVGFVHEMGVGDHSTRKDFFIYRARSLRSLAHLSPAGLYKTILMIDRASEASAEKILVMRV